MNLEGYRKVFRDIVEAKTRAVIEDKTYYIKHLSALDQVDIDDIKKKYYDNAISRGIPAQKDILKRLSDEGDWTPENEKEIKRQEAFIEQLQKNKTQLVLKSQIDQQNQTIQETRKKINELIGKKRALMGVNAEDYSDKRANDFYVIKSFYEDSGMEKPVFPNQQDFDDLYAEEMSLFVNAYNTTFLAFDELKIQEMILQDFYYIYFPFSDDTVGFFGKPVCQLTYNQLKLIVYTKIFKNIFENNKHIPQKIRKDPQALLDFGSISDEAKSKMQEKFDESQDGSTLFNATDEDFEYAGLEKPSDKPGISLQKAAEKKGGSLSMEDLMELSGIPKK